jgi:hypothetical protein
MLEVATRNEQLMDILELGSLIVPALPGRAEFFDVPGVVARWTQVSHPMLNLVAMTRLDPEAAEETIARVRALYASRGLAFGWVIAPRTRPTDLGERLRRLGFHKEIDYAGMALEDLSTEWAVNPAITVREATLDDLELANRVKARSFGLPDDFARFTNEVLLGEGSGFGARFYLAYLAGDPEPIGFAQSLMPPGVPIVLLAGAATLAEHRGKGTFRSLVARRIADARAAGATIAAIQAMRATSAPICARLGFREVCSLELWASP